MIISSIHPALGLWTGNEGPMQWIALLAFKPDSYHIIVRIVVDTSIQDVKQWMLSLSLGGGGENNWIFLHSILGSAGVATHVGWRRIGNINCAVMALGPLVAIADNQARFLEEFCQGP